MNTKKQLFAFSTPIEVFLNINEKVIVSWKDIDSFYYGINDVKANITDIPANTVRGERDEYFVTPKQATILRQHDKETITSRTTKIFKEKGTHKNGTSLDGLSMKTPLYDNVGKISGIFVLAFILNELSLPNISRIIKNTGIDTNILPTIMMLPDSDTAKLTKREKECVYHLARGRSFKEIANIFSISHRTVETHLAKAKIKLKCCTKSQLVSKVWDEGLLI